MNKIIYIIVNMFLLISFYIMVAGFSAYFAQELGISSIIGSFIIILMCYFIFMGNIKRIVKINTYLVPILIIFILLLIFKNINAIHYIELEINKKLLLKSMWDAIIYASYNSIVLIPILLSLQKFIDNKNQIKSISIIATIILVVLAISIYGVILKIDIDISKIELPTVYVASITGKLYKYFYGAVILMSIYTSAISAGYGFLENYTKDAKKYKIITIIICLTSIFISKIGFTKLIDLLYPIFGVFGIIQILFILKKK